MRPRSQTTEHEPLAYSVDEAARVCALGRTSLYAAAKTGALVLSKAGGRTIVRRENLQAFLRSLDVVR